MPRRVAVLLAALLLLPVASASAAERLIAPGGTNAGDCAVSPCATYAYAEGQASGGDVIRFAAGTYPGFTVTKDALTVAGPRAGEPAPGWTGPEAVIEGASGSYGIRVTAPGTTIDGLRVTSADPGDLATTGVTATQPLTLINTRVDDTSNGVTSGRALTLAGLDIDVWSYGIEITAANLNLQGSALVADDVGVALWGASSITATGNSIVGDAVAVFLPAAVTAATLRGNRLQGNFGVINDAASLSVAAEDNWWGCNGGPTAGACANTGGANAAGVDGTPWLVLEAGATTPVAPGAEAELTATVDGNSDGQDTPYGVFPATVAFGASAGTFDAGPTEWLSPEGAIVALTAPIEPQDIDWTATLDAETVNGELAMLTPVATRSPGSLLFANQLTGTTSAPRTVTVTNQGPGTMRVDRLTKNGTGSSLFGISADGCTGTTIPEGDTCTFDVTFAPLAAGSWTPRIEIFGTAPKLVVKLTGTANDPVAISPEGASFENIGRGRTSEPRSFVITNNTDSAVSIGTPRFNGTGASLFAVVANTCGSSLAAGASCTIDVTFTPQAVGTWTPTLAVPTGAGTVRSGLYGQGVPAVTTTDPVSFSTVPVGTSSSLTAAVFNQGANPVTVSALTKDGAGRSLFTISDDGCTGQTIQPDEFCMFTVTFSPVNTGSWSPRILVHTDVRTAPITVTGTGV